MTNGAAIGLGFGALALVGGGVALVVLRQRKAEEAARATLAATPKPSAGGSKPPSTATAVLSTIGAVAGALKSSGALDSLFS